MNFSAENIQLWRFIIEMGKICGILLIANILRSKIPLVKKALLPTSVLAGFILLLLRITNIMPANIEFLEMITYHGIAFGFIALSLRTNQKNKTSEISKFIPAKNGALIVSTYLLQAVVGLIISLGLAYTFMPELFKAAGVLLPMGFGQGPGQANNIGSTYQRLGFAGGHSYGLAIAAAGFLCACLVGIFYLNVLVRKKKIKRANAEVISGSITVDIFQDKNEIPISESIDRLSVQIAIVVVIYAVTFALMYFVTGTASTYAPNIAKLLNNLIWGFNFIIGIGVAMIFKLVLTHLRKTKIMRRQYCNNYLLNRISGFAFDIMITAGIASININEIKGVWVPFLITIVFGAIVTFLYLKWITKKLYPSYSEEAFVSMFGMLTGTISSGILLLRELDPLYKTPAANNLITGSGMAIILAIPILVLIVLAPTSPLMSFIVLVLALVYFLILLFFMLRVGIKNKAGKTLQSE
ncbi:MAG: hypothetical protein CR988_06310 [Treponema sp.]|nr:MAG: hypothetical protein CR988_06310 [Treponema sp.]